MNSARYRRLLVRQIYHSRLLRGIYLARITHALRTLDYTKPVRDIAHDVASGVDWLKQSWPTFGSPPILAQGARLPQQMGRAKRTPTLSTSSRVSFACLGLIAVWGIWSLLPGHAMRASDTLSDTNAADSSTLAVVNAAAANGAGLSSLAGANASGDAVMADSAKTDSSVAGATNRV